jgi:hypothetical protein
MASNYEEYLLLSNSFFCIKFNGLILLCSIIVLDHRPPQLCFKMVLASLFRKVIDILKKNNIFKLL